MDNTMAAAFEEKVAVGKRVADARRRRGWSQQELAIRAGYSKSAITKIERGDYESLKRPAVLRLAEALSVAASSLLGQPDADPPDSGEVTAWRAVRHAVGGRHEGGTDGQPPSRAHVEQGVASAVRLTLASRHAALRAALPALLRDADMLASAGTTHDSLILRARARLLAGYMLGQTWQLDAARDAMSLALDDAAADPGTGRAAAAWLTWVLLRSGDLDGCAALASDWADRCEPRMTRASRDEIAGWGRFQLALATAAARDNRPGEAASALRWARTAATAAGTDYIPASDPWRVFGPRTVEMAAGEIAVVQRRYGQALEITAGVDGRRFPVPRNWLRSRLDVAAAHAARREDHEAVATLVAVRAAAPEWLAQQRGARGTLGVVAKRCKRRYPEEVRDLLGLLRMPL